MLGGPFVLVPDHGWALICFNAFITLALLTKQQGVFKCEQIQIHTLNKFRWLLGVPMLWKSTTF